jgi:hypothetical protein
VTAFYCCEKGIGKLTKSHLGLALEVDDTSLTHLVVQVVTLTGTLTDTGKDRVTTVGLGNVVDEFLNQHSLADTGTTEKTNFTTTGVRGEEVDNLDTSLEDFGLGRLLNKLGRVGVDRGHLDTLDLTTHVDGLTNDVHDTTDGVSL